MVITKALYFEQAFCKVCLQPISHCMICEKLLFEHDVVDCNDQVGHVCQECLYGGKLLLKEIELFFNKKETYTGEQIHEYLKSLLTENA